VLLLGPPLMSIALATIVGASNLHVMPFAAFALGFGMGPMYPLLFSRVLHYGENGNIAFVLAGCGASFFPMLTGLVSGRTGSLRAGLLVPLTCTVLMACLGWMVVSRSRVRSGLRPPPDFL